jgi:hypothetical protein
MTEHLRKQVYQSLLARSNNGKLGKKDTTIVAEQFGLKIRAVQRLWKRGKTQLANSIPVDVSSLKKGRVGRKQIPVDLDALRNIPLKQRMTIDDVCKALNLSRWQIQRYLKKATLGATLVASNPISLKLTRGLGYSGVLTWLIGSCLMIQSLRSCMTLFLLMSNGFTYIKK